MRPPTWVDAGVQSLLDAMPISTLVVNREGEILFANVQAKELFGCLREELIGRAVESLIPPRFRAKHRQHREAFYVDASVQPMGRGIELFAQRTDGTEVPVDIHLSPLTNEAGTFIVCAILNATDHRRLGGEELSLNQKLHRSEEHRGRLVQRASVAMIVSRGLEEKVELVNDKFTELFGYTIDDMPDVGHWWPLAYPDEAYRQTVRTIWEERTEKAIRNKTAIEPLEATVRCKDGSTRHIEAHLSSVGDTNLVTLIDLTGRHQAEETIKESEKRYRRIVETTNEGVWLLDSKLRTSYVNRQMAEMLGYEPDEMLGRGIFDFWFPEDITHEKQLFERRQQEMREQIEERLRRKDGSELWVRLADVPLFKENGEFDGALAMVTDITQRKRAENALRESQHRLLLAVQAGGMYAFEWDTASDVITRSGEYTEIFNWTADPKRDIGREFLTKVHPDDRELYAAAAETGLTPEQPTYQTSFRMLRPDGSVIWLEESGRAYFDTRGKMLRIVGIVADVTERKRAEEALRESETRLRLALEVGRMYALDWDVVNDVTVRSDEYRNILGLTAARHDTHQQFLSRVHPDDRASFEDSIAALSPQSPTTQISYRVLRPDGAVIWLERNGRAFFDAHGKMVRMIGIVADVTERKRAEEALADISRRLIEAQELERARIARELHDDAGQRLATLALRIEQLRGDPSVEKSEFRARLDQLRKHTSEIANDVRILAHGLHPPGLDYLGIVGAARGLCQEFGEQQKVKIDLKTHDVPRSLPPNISLCLFRVLQEALHNSAKHSGAQEFEVRLWGTPDHVHLMVRDAGAGFELEAAGESRGLGLISMQERVKVVKGTFTIESQPKRGTTINVCVPLPVESDSMRATG